MMTNRDKYYDKKDKILKSNLSDLEKSSRLFNNWVDYVFKSADTSDKNNLKYSAERTRVNY
jgi:hypothetical protein